MRRCSVCRRAGMSNERDDMNEFVHRGHGAFLRLMFALSDGAFLAGVVLMATTITPLYEPGVSFAGVVVLAIVAAVALSAHLLARRRLRILPRAKIRHESQIKVTFYAFIGIEVICFVGALVALLNGAPILWTALAAGLAAALSSALLAARGVARISASSTHPVVAYRPVAQIAYAVA